MKRLLAILSLAICTPTYAQAEPNMAIRFGVLNKKYGHQDCVARAEHLMKEVFQLANVQPHSNGASGHLNDYTIQVSCMGSRGVYVVAVAGPEPDPTSEILEIIWKKF